MMTEMQEVIAEKESLLDRAKEDNEALQEQIRTNKERLSQQREQANKSSDHKDFRIFKLEKSNRRMLNDMVQAVEELENMDLDTPKKPTAPMMQKQLTRYKKQRQSIVASLKASIKSSSDIQEQSQMYEDGSERLKQLKDEHEAMVSTIQMIEDFNFAAHLEGRNEPFSSALTSLVFSCNNYLRGGESTGKIILLKKVYKTQKYMWVSSD